MPEPTLISKLPQPTIPASLPESQKTSSKADRPIYGLSVEAILDMYCVPALYRRWKLEAFLGVTAVKWDQGGVLIVGATGTGKSCLAAALFRQRLRHDHPKTLACESDRDTGARYVLFPKVGLWRRCGEILFDARGSFRDGGVSESDLIHQCTEPDLLVMDDLCAGKMTDSGWTILSEIIARRVDDESDTIVTTNLSLEEIHGQEPRLASRLGSFEEIALKGKDRRLD